MLKCVCCLFLFLSLRISAEMLGYSYELDTPYSGPKNRAVPNFMMRSVVLPLQRINQIIEVFCHYCCSVLTIECCRVSKKQTFWFNLFKKYFQIWLRKAINAPTKISQKQRKIKVKKRNRNRFFSKYKKDSNPTSIPFQRDKYNRKLLPSMTPTIEYQKQNSNSNSITDETKNPDCTLRKWFWACKHFQSWNENIF